MRLVEGTLDVGPDGAFPDVTAFVAALDAVGARYDCAVQAFDARFVAGPDHLRTAVEHANRAFARGENVARERSVEILLYAAGRRQIDRALRMGVDEGRTQTVVVVDGDAEARAAAEVRDLLTPAPTLDAGDPSTVRGFFCVSEREAATDAGLEALVCERVALLDVEK